MNAWGAFNIYVIIRKYITSCSVDITCYKSIPSAIRYFFFDVAKLSPFVPLQAGIFVLFEKNFRQYCSAVSENNVVRTICYLANFK